MNLSSRELVLLFATLTAALFGVTAIIARPKWDEWQNIRKAQQALHEEIAIDERLIQQREKWAQRFDELKNQLPQYAESRNMDVHWMSFMDRVAQEYSLKIDKRQARSEIRQGDIYELPIECRDWSGSLEALTRFLYALQEDGAMLDIRELSIKSARENSNTLRGKFLLHCAYTREGGSGAAGMNAGGRTERDGAGAASRREL